MTKATYVAFGVPMGFSCTPAADAEDRAHQNYIKQFYVRDKGCKMLVDKQKDNKVYYTFLVYDDDRRNFCDSNGRTGSFFGFSIGFNNAQAKDPKTMWTFLKDIYEESIKGNIVDEKPLFTKYKIPSLNTPQVGNFIRKALEKEINKGGLDLIPFRYNAADPTNRQVFRPVAKVQPMVNRRDNTGR